MTPRNAVLPALLAAFAIAVPVRAHADEPTAAAYDDEPAPTATQSESSVPPPRPTETTDASPSSNVDIQAGKRLRTSGIVTLSVGAIGLAVGAGLEHKRRTDVCKDILSADHKDACDRSKMANITLIALGSTMLIGGVVLTAIGQQRINRARASLAARGISFGPQLARGFAGASFTARF